jgi:hypothetical protein
VFFYVFFSPRRDAVPGAPIGAREMRAPVVSGACHVAQMEDVAMRNLDLAPFWRSTVGFDRFFDLVEDSRRWSGEDN